MDEPKPIAEFIPPSPKETDALYFNHAMMVGRVSCSWNMLHERLADIFVALIESELARSVWYSTESDRSQRKMLASVVKAKTWPESLPKAKDDITWILNRTESTSDRRNTAVHTPIAIFLGPNGTPTQIGPHYMYGHPRAVKVLNENLFDLCLWCESQAVALSNFSWAVSRALRKSGNWPWPDRHSLPILGQKRLLPGKPRPPHKE